MRQEEEAKDFRRRETFQKENLSSSAVGHPPVGASGHIAQVTGLMRE